MSNIKNVILVGASGNLGPSILNAFLTDGSFNITVLSRAESTKTFPDSVKLIKSDFTASSLESAFKGQDAVVSIVGAGGFAQQTALIDAAIKAGVKRFVPSEFGSDTTLPDATKLVPLFVGKVAAVDYLKSKEDVISWTALITGPFFDWGLKVGFLGFDLKAKSAKLWDDGSAKFSSTNLNTIGLAVVKVLSTEETKNKEIFVASQTTSQKEILAVLEKLSGEKWSTTTQDSAKLQKEYLEGGNGFGLIQLYNFADKAEGGNHGDFSKKIWNEKLGLPKEDLEDSLRKVLQG